MKKIRPALAIGVLGCLASMGTALAEDVRTVPTKPHGLELGARTGYGVPFGTAVDNTNYSDLIGGMVPLWADVGFRFTPAFYLGGFFQYGLGWVPSAVNCTGGLSCSTNDLRFGLNAHIHFAPAEPFDPWFGLGAGYEIWNFNASTSNASQSASLKGIEFVNAQAGLDFRGSPNFGVGPFVAFSLSQFSSASGSVGGQAVPLTITSKGIHEWLLFGLRGIFDLGSE